MDPSIFDSHGVLQLDIITGADLEIEKGGFFSCPRFSNTLPELSSLTPWITFTLSHAPLSAGRLTAQATSDQLFLKPTIQWSLRLKDTLGAAILPFFERLSSSRRLKMNYRYRNGVQKSVPCWEVVPFSEGPLLEVPL